MSEYTYNEHKNDAPSKEEYFCELEREEEKMHDCYHHECCYCGDMNECDHECFYCCYCGEKL